MNKHTDNPYLIGVKSGVKTATEKHAVLIAAAPDLLEACHITLRTINDTLRHVKMPEGCEVALELCCVDLKNAIHQAEGRSHDTETILCKD